MFFKPMPIFIAIFSFLIVMKLMLKKSSNGFDEAVDDFIKRENEANYVRKDFKSLDLPFVTPCNDLPFKSYEEEDKFRVVIKKQEMAKRKVNLEMIKLPQNLSNTDLKEQFGINNFDKITILEEHYNSYIRALFEWGVELVSLENIEDAKKVLLEAVRLEGNISQVYTLLADIYTKEKDKASLIALREKVENIDLSLKDKTLNTINKNIESL